MSARAAQLAAVLAHDVGKYIARAAHNFPPRGEILTTLAEMLIRDLFETHAGLPALTRFDELAPELATLTSDPRLDAVRTLLVNAAAHEHAAREGNADALRALAVIALAVESTLRALSRDLRGGTHP